MKTMFKTIFQVLLMLTLPCGLVFGQAEKATAASSAVTFSVFSAANVGPVVGPFFDAITATIKPPAGQSDLLVTLSAATLLNATSTNADLSPVLTITSTTLENTAIQVRLLVDGTPVPFAGAVTIVTLDSLVKVTTLRIAPPITTDTLSQIITLGGVRALTWIVPDVGNAEHTVTVQARFAFTNSALPIMTGQFSSIAEVLGPRTLTVEGVNIKSN